MIVRRILLLLLSALLLVSCERIERGSPDPPGAPPPGLYHCWAGGFDHLPAGSFTLDGRGRYETERPGGGGKYSFSAAGSELDFLSGDYHSWEYRGIFQDNLKLPSGARQRIVLLPFGAQKPIGAERPGEYQYCYLGGTRG